MNDLISRQVAIDEINERQRKLIYCFGFENDMVKIMDIAKSIISTIPSAQPEITDIQAIEQLQASGWIQKPWQADDEAGLKEHLSDDGDSYGALLPSAQSEQTDCE